MIIFLRALHIPKRLSGSSEKRRCKFRSSTDLPIWTQLVKESLDLLWPDFRRWRLDNNFESRCNQSSPRFQQKLLWFWRKEGRVLDWSSNDSWTDNIFWMHWAHDSNGTIQFFKLSSQVFLIPSWISGWRLRSQCFWLLFNTLVWWWSRLCKWNEFLHSRSRWRHSEHFQLRWTLPRWLVA